MTSIPQKKSQSTNSYKYIHSKLPNSSAKNTPQIADEKNAEYFPNKISKKQPYNYHLDSSRTNISNRQSDTSRNNQKSYSINDTLRMENKTMEKNIVKLKKQVEKYQKMIFEKEDQGNNAKKMEVELMETYRVIHYYEGKIKELEKRCEQYEQDFYNKEQKSGKSLKLIQTVQLLRKDNSELSGKLEQKQYQLNKNITDLRKFQSKFHTNEQKIIELNKSLAKKRQETPRQKGKFIDDYSNNYIVNANNHSNSKSKQKFIKRRPGLSGYKRITKGLSADESGSQQSGVGSQYRSKVRLKYPKEQTSKKLSNHYGNINSKLNIIEKEIQKLKQQNQNLHKQLDLKVNEIGKLKEKVQSLQPSNSTKAQNENIEIGRNDMQKIVFKKQLLKQIPKPVESAGHQKATDQKLSMFVSNLSNNKTIISNPLASGFQKSLQNKVNQRKSVSKNNSYKFSQITDKTIRRLTVNIIREDITHNNLIENIAKSWTSQTPNCLIQLLEDTPYQLPSNEVSQFMFEYKQIIKHISSKQKQSAHKDMNEQQYKKYVEQQIKNILKDNIPYFKNITIRRDYTLNIQISNKFKNYQEQVEQLIRKYDNNMPFKEFETIFLNKWGFTNQQFLFLLVKNNQQYDEIDNLHISDLSRYFLLD